MHMRTYIHTHTHVLQQATGLAVCVLPPLQTASDLHVEVIDDSGHFVFVVSGACMGTRDESLVLCLTPATTNVSSQCLRVDRDGECDKHGCALCSAAPIPALCSICCTPTC